MESISTFTVWVTTACNMKCKYCYEGADKANVTMSEKVAEDVARWILNQAKRSGHKHSIVRFHGGEPTINMPAVKRMVGLLDQAEDLTFDYHMTSNGFRITEEDIAYLADHMADISISLDGKQDINDRNRIDVAGLGTFERVYSNALSLKQQCDKLWIRMTVNAQTCTNLAENVIFFLDKGFQNVSVAPDFADENWTVELVDILEQQCQQIWNYREDKQLEGSVVLPLMDTVTKLCSCAGGEDKFDIDASGKLYPCTYVVGEKLYCMGDIYSGLEQNAVQKIKDICRKPVEQCMGCGGYESCLSVRCKFVNEKLTGNCFQPIPLVCELHRREMNRLI